MDIHHKAALIHAQLEDYYPETPIPLDHSDPYTLLIAVLLSAQSRDVRVNRITPALFAKAKTPAAMIELTPKEIEAIIKPCGLAPRKSQAIWELSHILLGQHGGEVPRTLEELEKLPGVGHKTASVVVAQAFDIPAFPGDTHIHRLAARWQLSTGRNVVHTERDLKALFPPKSWNKIHLQIIFFGREYCPARGHILEQCPICSWASEEGDLSQAPDLDVQIYRNPNVNVTKTKTKKASKKKTQKKSKASKKKSSKNKASSKKKAVPKTTGKQTKAKATKKKVKTSKKAAATETSSKKKAATKKKSTVKRTPSKKKAATKATQKEAKVSKKKSSRNKGTTRA